MAGEELALPASALAETLVAPARAGKLEEARQRIQALELVIADVNEDVALEAARWRGRHGRLRLPDALVLATAEVLGASVLLTGDASWKALSRRVQVSGRSCAGFPSWRRRRAWRCGGSGSGVCVGGA